MLPPEVRQRLDQYTELSYEEQQQLRCDEYNRYPGNLTGYDCPECLNRGGSNKIVGDEIVFAECKCKEIRRNLNRIERSGLKDMLGECTFDRFNSESEWQKSLKQSALSFISDNYGKWFFVGGQVGCGKTHICTALVGELLKSGKSARYMLWRDEAVQLKACVTDDYQYSNLINPLKTVDVLYIDDFFKTARGSDGIAKPPTSGDINVAFEILNHRYNNRELVTIISCEHYVDDLINVDESIGSRIYQRTKEYCNIIGRDKKRNYRLYGSEK